MSEDELTRLEALDKAATPGPWWPRWGGEPGFIAAKAVIGEIYAAKTDAHRDPNLDLIVASRTALPALIAEVRRLRAWRETAINAYPDLEDMKGE